MRVSVCLPTYNGEAFVAEAVRSVLAQRWQDFELLVIDDQSTDATLDVVRSFADPTELEEDKTWLEEQWHSSQGEAGRWQAEVAQWQKSPWVRLGVH